MKTFCDFCRKEFNQKPSKIKTHNYCCKEHRHLARYKIVKCCTCGITFERAVISIKKHNFCSMSCAKVFTSKRLAAYNIEHNPSAMDFNRRSAIRKTKLGRGACLSYEKTFGRHTHRIVAERMLGRELKKGEVVHHIDGNKRNNSPDNLMVFNSQGEHAKWHVMHDGNIRERGRKV